MKKCLWLGLSLVLQCPRNQMKSLTDYLALNTPTKRAFTAHGITPQVAELVRKSGVKEGIALCNAVHITASVFVNDDESGLHRDFDKWLEKLAPYEPTSQYAHNNGEDREAEKGKGAREGKSVVIPPRNKPGRQGPSTL